MSENVKIIEFESVKKGKNILFISLICAAAALAVVFLLLWVLAPKVETPGGSVRDIEFTNSSASGQTLREEMIDGKKIYIASTGRIYSFSALLVGDGGAGMVDWEIAPLNMISDFSVSADPQNAAMVRCSFAAGGQEGQVTITAKTGDKIIGEFSFDIREQFVESLVISEIKNKVTNAPFTLTESNGLTVKLPYFSEKTRAKYNVFTVDSVVGAKFDLSDYQVDGKPINALKYNLVCTDNSMRLVETGVTGTHVQIEILKVGSARLQIRANQNNAWAQERDCLVDLAIQSVPLSDSSMQFILSEIGLKSGVAREHDTDEFPTIELFLHENNFYLHHNSAFEDRNNLTLYPATGSFGLKAPREVYADGRDRLEADVILNTGNLGEFRLNPLKAGETFLLVEDGDSGYGAQLMVRVIVFRPVTKITSDDTSASNRMDIVCQAADPDLGLRIRYTLDNRSDLSVPLAQQVKSALFFYYPTKDLEPAKINGTYSVSDGEAYAHTVIVDGMSDTGYVNPETGLRLFAVEPELIRPSQYLVADLVFATGETVQTGDIELEFFLDGQYRTTRPFPAAVKFTVKISVMQTIQGLRFNYENFNRLIGAYEDGTRLYAVNAAGNPVWEASDSDTFYTTAVLVKNVGENNANARFNIFDLFRYYDAAGKEFGTHTELLPRDVVAGITVERVAATGGGLGWPINLSTISGDYGRFISRSAAFAVPVEYEITVAPNLLSGVPAGASGKLMLKVLYYDEVQSLTLTSQATRTVSYVFNSANTPSLGNISRDEMQIAYVQQTNPTNVTNFAAQYLNIFVRHDGEARMLYRYPQTSLNPGSTTYRYYDYDYVTAFGEPNPVDALFVRAPNGEVSVNRDLYLYSYLKLLAGRSAYDEFELVYTVEQLYNDNEPNQRYIPVIQIEQAVRGYTVDKILEISQNARARYRAERLFDEIGFFNSAHERLISSVANPITVLSEHSEKIYASGIIGGINVVNVETQKTFLTALHKDSLTAIAKSGAITDGTNPGEYRFMAESTSQDSATANLSVQSVRGQIAGSVYFSVHFKNPMPIKTIQIFQDAEGSDEVTAGSGALRLARENISAPAQHVKQLYLRVTYDGSAYGTGLDKVKYETFDAIVLERLSAGTSIVQVAYSDESNNLMKLVAVGDGFENTEKNGTDYVRHYVLTLTALDGFSELTQQYRIIPKHPVEGTAAVQSETFAVRVTSYAEYIQVQSQSGSVLTDLILVMKNQVAGGAGTVVLKQFVGGAAATSGLTENFVYNYTVLVPGGTGGFVEDNTLVTITPTAVVGEFHIQTRGKVATGAKIQFVLTYKEPGGLVTDTFMDVLTAELNLDIVSDVFGLGLDTSVIDPDGLHAGGLPIVVLGGGAEEMYAVGRAEFVFNGGSSAYAPSIGRYEVSYAVKRNGVTQTEYPFELYLIGKAALGYRVRNDLAGAGLSGYQVVITVANTGNATPFTAQFDLIFETLDFTLAFEQVYLDGDAQKSFVIVTDAQGNQSMSLFTELNAKVCFVAVARNAWTGAPLTGASLAALGNIAYAESGIGTSFAAGTNLLTVTSLDTEQFAVTATAANGAGSRTAQITVSKFNRIKEFALVGSAQMPKPVMRVTEFVGADFAVTMVKSSTQESSLNLIQYLQAIGDNGVEPFTGGFTADVSGSAATLNGNVLTTRAAGTSVITVTADKFAWKGYIDSVSAATVQIRVTVVELSVAVTGTQPLLNFGLDNSFSFHFTVTDKGGASFDLSDHAAEYTVREKTTKYIGEISGSVDGADNIYTVTINAFKKNLGAVSQLTFEFECTVDGVNLTDTVDVPIALLSGMPDFTLTRANGVVLGVDEDGVYQLDHQLDQSVRIAFSGEVLAQLSEFAGVTGLEILYKFESSHPDILKIESGASTSDPLIAVVGKTQYGSVSLKLTLTVSGVEFTNTISVDVFNSAKIQTKVFAGGTLSLESDTLYTLTGASEIADGASLAVDYGTAQTGMQSSKKVYLAAEFDQQVLPSLMDKNKFTMFVSNNSLRATGTTGFIDGEGNIRYYFVEYEVSAVSAPSTPVKFRTTALIGSYYYTADIDATLTANAPVFSYQEASGGEINTVPASSHDIIPIVQNLASEPGAAGFYGTYRTVYEWTSYNISAGALEVIDGVLVVAPRVGSGTAALRITVFIESGAFTGWSDVSLTQTVIIRVESAGAPTFVLEEGDSITLERAESDNKITVDLFHDYIKMQIPTDYSDAANYTLTPAIVELGYADGETEMTDFVTDLDTDDQTFKLELPNRIFYGKFSVTLSFLSGQWKGYSQTLTLSFYVSPQAPDFVLSGEDVQTVTDAYLSGDGNAVTVKGVSAGGIVTMNATVEEFLNNDPYREHFRIGYTVASEDNAGVVSAQSHIVQGIGYIDGNQFITDVRGKGGVVYLYAVIEFIDGPYRGLQFSFAQEVFVFSLTARGQSIGVDADYAVTSDGVFIRSGKFVDLKLVLSDTTMSSAFERVPQKRGNRPATDTYMQGVALIDPNHEKPAYLLDSGDSVISIKSGALYQPEGIGTQSYLNLGPILTVSIHSNYAGNVYVYRKVVNLYVMPESLPTVSVTSDNYFVAGNSAAQTNATGSATLYPGDTVVFGVSAGSVVMQQIDLYLKSGSAQGVLCASASSSEGGLTGISYTVPSSLASGTYSVYVVATIAGHTRMSAVYGRSIVVGTPLALGDDFTLERDESQLFIGGKTQFTLSQQAGTAKITRVKLIYPQSLNLVNTTDFTAMLKDGFYTAYYNAPSGNAVSLVSWTLESVANTSILAEVGVTVYTHTATDLTGSYRYDGSAAVQLLASTEQVKMVQPKAPLSRYFVAMDDVVRLDLTATHLDFSNMKHVVYSVTKADGESTDESARVTLEQDESGSYPLGHVYAEVLSGSRSDTRFAVLVTLVSYQVGGKTIAVNSAVTVEFVPTPRFSVAVNEAKNTITVTSNMEIDIASYELLSGSSHITADSIQRDASGKTATFRFTPHYIVGAANQLSVRLVAVITEAGAYRGMEFALDPIVYNYANIGVDNPFPNFEVEEAERSGLMLSGELLVKHATGATEVDYSISQNDRLKFNAVYPGSVSGSGIFEFEQSMTDQTVLVTVTAISASASYTMYYLLTNYAVPAPSFEAGVQSGNGFTIDGNVSFVISAKSVVSGSAFIKEDSLATSGATVTFVPVFDQNGANAATIVVTLTVDEQVSPYHGKIYTVRKDVTIADTGILTAAIGETDRTQATTIAGRLTGALNVSVSDGITVAYETENRETYFASFDTLTGTFTFKESPYQQTRTVKITATVTATGATYVYYYTLTNYAIEPPVFIVSVDPETDPYIFIITGMVDGIAYELSSAVVTVTPRILSGGEFFGGFTYAEESATLTMIPKFIWGAANRVEFEIIVKIVDENSAFYGRSYVVKLIPDEGDAQDVIAVEIQNDLGILYNGTEGEIQTSPNGTETVEEIHAGTITVALDDSVIETLTYSFIPDNANLFEVGSFTAVKGSNKIITSYTFKKSTADVSSVVTIRFVTGSGATYTYFVTLSNSALSVPLFVFGQNNPANPYEFTLTGTAGGLKLDMTKVNVQFVRISGKGYEHTPPAIVGTASEQSQIWSFTPQFIQGELNLIEYRITFEVTDELSVYKDQIFAITTGEIEIEDAYAADEDNEYDGIEIDSSARTDALGLSGTIEVDGIGEGDTVTFAVSDWQTYFTSFNTDTGEFTFRQSAVTQTVKVEVTVKSGIGYYTYFFPLTNHAISAPVFTAKISKTAPYDIILSGIVGDNVPIDMEEVSVTFTLISGGGYVHISTDLTEPASLTASKAIYRLIPRFFEDAYNRVEYRIIFTISENSSSVYAGKSFAITTGEIEIEDAYAADEDNEYDDIEIDSSARTDALGLSGTIEVDGIGESDTVTFAVSDWQTYFTSFNTETGEFTFRQSAVTQTVKVEVTVFNGAGYYTYYDMLTNKAIPAPVFVAEVKNGDEIWVSGMMAGIKIKMTEVDVTLNVLSGAPFVIDDSITKIATDDDFVKFTFAKNFTQDMTGQSVRFEAACSFKTDSDYTHQGRTFTALADSAIVIHSIFVDGDAISDVRDGDSPAERLSGAIVIPQLEGSPSIFVSVADAEYFVADSYPGNEDNPLEFTFNKNRTANRIHVVVTVVLETQDGSTYTYYYTLTNEPFPTATFAYEITSDTISGGTMLLTMLDADDSVEFISYEFKLADGEKRLSFGEVDTDGEVTFAKHHKKIGGMVEVVIVMTYKDETGTHAVERTVSIYVAPASPLIHVGEDALINAETQEYAIEVMLVTDLGEDGETFELNTATSDATILSGHELLAEPSFDFSDNDSKLVFSYKKADTLAGGTARILVVLYADGVAAAYYAMVTVTVDALTADIFRIEQVETGAFAESLGTMQYGYRLLKNIGGEEAENWVAYALPAGWEVTYQYTPSDNGGNIDVTFVTDVDGNGILSYRYNALSSEEVTFTVTATIAVAGNAVETDSVDGEVAAWMFDVPIEVDEGSFTASDVEEDNGDDEEPEEEEGEGDGEAGQVIVNKLITVHCGAWIVSDDLTEWYESRNWYESLTDELVLATRNGEKTDVDISSLSEDGTFTVFYGDTQDPNEPVILTVTIDLGDQFSDAFRMYTLYLSISCDADGQVAVQTITVDELP